jgi:hypothetical protein
MSAAQASPAEDEAVVSEVSGVRALLRDFRAAVRPLDRLEVQGLAEGPPLGRVAAGAPT